MHRSAIESSVLSMYPETFPNLANFSSFFVNSVGFSIYMIMSSTHGDSFYFFLSNLDGFYFFFLASCFDSTMLNRSGEIKHPCLAPP